MMEAKYYEYGQYTVIEVKGRLEPDQNKPFRDVCERMLKNREVIFCLNDLSFTASANLTTFFESIQLIPRAKVVGLKTDFHRLLELKGYTKGVRSFKTLHDAIVETESISRDTTVFAPTIAPVMANNTAMGDSTTVSSAADVVNVAAVTTAAVTEKNK